MILPDTQMSIHMRIALFTETFLPKIDGVVTIIEQMHQRIVARGHQVIIYAPPGAPDEFHGSRVYPSWGPPFPLYPELWCSFPTRSGIRAIRAFQPDIIHVMNPTFIGTAGIIMATIGHVPLVASVHMDIDHYVKQYAGTWGLPIAWTFFRFWHSFAQINLAPSQATCSQLVRNGIPNVAHWQRGIDLTRFRKTTASTALRDSLCQDEQHTLIALYVGRLSREKGLPDLLPLCAIPGIQLVLVGGGPETEQIKALFSNTNARFVGILRGEALIEMYNSADLFVFPSQSETFGLAPLEAMACGLSVVAPFVGGLTETMRHMQNGLTYDHSQPAQLVNAVQLLAANHELRQQLATQAYAYAQTCDWQYTMDWLVDQYEQLGGGTSDATT